MLSFGGTSSFRGSWILLLLSAVLCVETQASLEKVLGVSRAFDLLALQPDQGSRSQLLPLISTVGVCTGCEWLVTG